MGNPLIYMSSWEIISETPVGWIGIASIILVIYLIWLFLKWIFTKEPTDEES